MRRKVHIWLLRKLAGRQTVVINCAIIGGYTEREQSWNTGFTGLIANNVFIHKPFELDEYEQKMLREHGFPIPIYVWPNV